VNPAAGTPRVAVVIPCFKVKDQILGVLSKIGPECHAIYVVDDACPEGSGALVTAQCTDPRVKVLRRDTNGGVGAAVITGLRQAMEDGATIMVKLDGDGQMDPALVPRFLRPLLAGKADYAKGNRFHDLAQLRQMPWVRLLGNAALSFIAKLSSGYWNVFDPTNGFLAIHRAALQDVRLDRVAQRYFFESDLLFHLYLARAVVVDVPMVATYGSEKSGLRPGLAVLEFGLRHMWNFMRRILYMYFLRDFSVASIEILVAPVFLVFGTGYGAFRWAQMAGRGVEASAGTVMLAALPIILAFQMLLSFLGFDQRCVPTEPRQQAG